MEHILKKAKGLHRNIYQIPIAKEYWIDFILVLLGASAISDAAKNWLTDTHFYVFATVLLGLVLFILKSRLENPPKVVPYGPKPQFIGLYSIESREDILNIDKGMIPRNIEINCLHSLIKECFAQPNPKRGICLIGRSGTGKSTIISQFEFRESAEFEIKNFSESYDFFEDYILNLYQDVPEKNLIKNTVFILDHFERFFSLPAHKKESIKKTVKRLSKLSTVFIFSMRQEFFVPFLMEFNINNLTDDLLCKTEYQGILFFKEAISGNKNTGDDNVLICTSEQDGTDGKVEKTMTRLCEQAFDVQRGKEIYEHFKNASLIQQQIVFNMLAHEFTENSDIPVLEPYMDADFMMKRYFDVQLCSTGDYFMASRILYFLCQGHNSGISFTDMDVKNALCIFEEKDVKDFNVCLDKLHDLKLIRYSARNSTRRYEIAHDYIAKTFETYANREFNSNVKNALDEYRSEYVRNTDMKKMIEDYRRKKKWKTPGNFGITVFIFSLIIACVCFVIDAEFKDLGLSWQVYVICLVSLLYVYTFYQNITRHYRRKLWILVPALYILSMFCGTMGIVCSDYWLIFLGAGNASIGASCIIIGANASLAQMPRKWFLSYGLKTFAVGGLLIAMAVIVKVGVSGVTWNIGSIMQFLPMTALLIYVYLAHMNKEFFYAGVEGIFSTGDTDRGR